MAGGGVRGREAGTGHAIMIQAGTSTGMYHLFMRKYPPAGEMSTGTAAGEGINGPLSGYPINRYSGIGIDGKRTDIGRRSRPGVFRVCMSQRDRGRT